MPRIERILITGAGGLLGNKITAIADKDFTVTPTDIIEPVHENAVRADITAQIEIRDLFKKYKPNVVVHSASETNVDKCERERDHAWKVNTKGTENIAAACEMIEAKLVYISTDYVFDGEKGWYNEEDYTNPINHYGLTKLEGEKQVLKHCKNCAILRTSVLYGKHPYKQDFATWIINKLRLSQEITVVEDHINTPTLADNLAEMILEIAIKDLKGLYHASGSERITRFEFAKQIAETFNLNSDLIKPMKMEELKAWIAKRPRDSSLNTDKIWKQLVVKPMNIKEGLNKLKMELGT